MKGRKQGGKKKKQGYDAINSNKQSQKHKTDEVIKTAHARGSEREVTLLCSCSFTPVRILFKPSKEHKWEYLEECITYFYNKLRGQRRIIV